jgi:DNA invertase Pin-like site-specific DNA recombinase
VSKLDRLSARAYGRLTPEKRQAADLLEWRTSPAADRGRAKSILGWRPTREETVAYARELIAGGLMASAVADRLQVSDRSLKRVLNPKNQARNRAAQAKKFGLPDSGKVADHPGLKRTA